LGRVLITGGTGMVGSAFLNLDVDSEFVFVGSKEYDLRIPEHSKDMIYHHEPEAIIHLAAKVGGVKGNTDFVADFFYENTMINCNVLNAAHEAGVSKVVSLLSTCVYPDDVKYPLTENQIHSGNPHSSNFGYAYAKRMLDIHSRALRQQYGRNYVCAVPNNLYGPHDNFDLENGHVIPALIRKIWEAKMYGTIPQFWGDGSPLREFTYSNDIAKALMLVLDKYNDPHPVNIGNVGEVSIKSLVDMICRNLEYTGNVVWDETKPSGQFKKPSSNANFIKAGWDVQDYTSLEQGLKETCDWFVENYPNVRGVK
tara:strand:- start:311 stop:1243 length:933 start_codon:yes stop_codon:yes gene_type:complete